MEQFNERDLHKPIGFTFDVPRNGDTVKTGEIDKKTRTTRGNESIAIHDGDFHI